MGIIANGSNITAVNANGTDIQTVYVNGAQVWSKTPSKWKNAWSGMAYVADFGDRTQGAGTYDYTFTGMSTNTYGKVTQVDADYVFAFTNNGEMVSQTLTAPRNEASAAPNLPWTVSNGTLSALKQTGSRIYISGDTLTSYLWGELIKGCFRVRNIWYYDG